MKTVICSLPNASTEINGVQFERDELDGSVSAVVEDDVAAQFDGIPGYLLIDNGPKEPEAQTKPTKKTKQDVPAEEPAPVDTVE